nr:glycosyltransferase family 2 protein [Mucilaginibacter sp. L294]
MNVIHQRPLVSIITVVYNAASTLEQTITSVLGQSYSNIQYIVIDGGSTDGSVDLITKYSDRIAYWISEPDSGIYDAMNKGLKIANGELIGIINSDDWYESDAVVTMVEAFQTHPLTDIFHGILRFIGSNEQLQHVAGHPVTFLKTGMIEHPTCFVRSNLYRKLGFFDKTYRAAADYEFVNRALKNGAKFRFIEKIIANFRAGGITSTENSAQEELAIKYRYGHISKLKYWRWRIILKIIYLFK